MARIVSGEEYRHRRRLAAYVKRTLIDADQRSYNLHLTGNAFTVIREIAFDAWNRVMFPAN